MEPLIAIGGKGGREDVSRRYKGNRGKRLRVHVIRTSPGLQGLGKKTM